MLHVIGAGCMVGGIALIAFGLVVLPPWSRSWLPVIAVGLMLFGVIFLSTP